MSDARGRGRRGQTASFLVRFWREPREKADDQPVVRGYLRNLGSGEELYLRDPEQLGVHILRHLRLEGLAGERTSTDREDLEVSNSK